ncbi:MAG: hypothetical protein LBP22_06105, partial [Deltaproteobacteria bacterium]|nr:hypothetical protein [Deltaproteobacteria bacterium]
MANRSVYLEGPLKRTALYAPIAGPYMTLDETSDHILGGPAFLKRQAEASWLNRLFPCFLKNPEAVLSHSFSPAGTEALLASGADGLIIWRWNTGAFDAVKFPWLIKMDAYFGDLPAVYKLMADLTGKHERNEALWRRYEERQASLLRRIDFSRPPAGVLALGVNRFMRNANNKDFNYGLEKINACNLAREIKTYRAAVNIEQLLQFDPEVLFVFDYFDRYSVKDVYADLSLSTLSAVRNRRVYRMPVGASYMDGPVEGPIMDLWMALMIHPDLKP